MKPENTGNFQRITIKGNPSAEEQALIFARLQMSSPPPNTTEPKTRVHHSNPWIRAARSEQLNRWPQGIEDRYWHP